MSSPEQPTYWCYRCVRFVAVSSSGDRAITCPHCDSGFIEEVTAIPSSDSEDLSTRLASQGELPSASRQSLRFRRRRVGDRTVTPPFNPVVVLRGPSNPQTDEGEEEINNRYEFFYDDGSGSGLRPVPPGVSDFLMGWGFDRLLEQLSQVEGLTGGRRARAPLAAAKSAVEAMPTVGITTCHVVEEEHCAVCKEAFMAGSEAREMPCRHLYHAECILPWLATRNSCPVCRFEVEAETATEEEEEGGDVVGLTIWRLPGGGFAVGRFNGGNAFPFPETANSAGSIPRRVSWGRRRGPQNDPTTPVGASRIRTLFRGLLSMLTFRSSATRLS